MSRTYDLRDPFEPIAAAGESDERTAVPSAAKTWITAAHLVPLTYYFFWWIPGTALVLVAPLLISRYKGRIDPLVVDQAREAFNFHLAAAAVALVLSVTIVGWMLYVVLVVAVMVLTILACVNGCEGERYRYPWIPRLFV